MNFWQALPEPIIGMSPMDGYTDASFRQLVCEAGKPDVVFTEFINFNQLLFKKTDIIGEFLYHEIERPVVAQIFGKDPDKFYQFAKVVCELGFDGLDINMGCPARNVSKHGSGAGLIKTPGLAVELIKAVKLGISDWCKSQNNDFPFRIQSKIDNTKELLTSWGVKFSHHRNIIPVSVKTRIGFDTDIIERWLENLLIAEPDCITVHGRTLKQMYSGACNWESIARGKASIDKLCKPGLKPVYLGNGDIISINMAKEYSAMYNLGGVLVGRAVLGNPGFFNGTEKVTDPSRVKSIILMHSKLKQQYFPEKYYEIRKHLMWYTRGMANSANLRSSIAHLNTHKELEEIFSVWGLDKRNIS